MNIQPRELRNYLKVDGTNPFDNWFDSLRDRKVKSKIRARLDRVEDVNLGYCESVRLFLRKPTV
ncbi:hypothetical protein [Anabaena sp. PCC 7108]|uniref:hypothetical protein n=1 Tax=Anabaena sp. PCC 7108 TaxID=163908 RepID=UPI000346EF86|nr:hypothetical protein [Anabaena sp. PCC 7108]